MGTPAMITTTHSAPIPHKTYLNADKGLLSWLLTRDHKRIGLMFLASVILFLFVGGIFALLVRMELLTPGPTIMDAATYNRMFTLHGIVMIFLFMIPAIPSAFGNFVLPIMLGAEDVAFPRLNLGSFYVYLAGACIALWGMLHGGTDTGWTFYTPYSATTPTQVVPVVLGAFVIGFSSIMTGLNFIVTTHTMRAKGMTWMRMPLFVWAIYGTSVIQVLATPVIGMLLVLVAIDNGLGVGIFDPTRGGDPVMFQHFFWFYSHPAVYIMILPSMGVMSELVATFSRKNYFGYKAIAYATLGIAFVGFFVWGHHLYVAGQSKFDNGVFGVLTMFVGVFTAIKVFNWLATMYKGSINFSTPFAYVCGFLYMLIFGGMTGIALATISLDAHWHDTYFVVAHFHFIMVGSTIMAFLAALHYWFPKMFGRMYWEKWGLVSAVFIFMGFNATFIPQFLLGNAGMPRRYYFYAEQFQTLNVMSTAGASLLLFGFLLTGIHLAIALKLGPKAGVNPFESRGFEWNTLSPPVKTNFEVSPTYTDGPHLYDQPRPAFSPVIAGFEPEGGAEAHEGGHDDGHGAGRHE
jgi:cytochrome c oxidase subunit 1